MIRSAVGVVLFIYFLGANALAPIRPNFFGDPLVAFHREINRGVARLAGPPVRAVHEFFGGSDDQKVNLRPTIGPNEEVSGKDKI